MRLRRLTARSAAARPRWSGSARHCRLLAEFAFLLALDEDVAVGVFGRGASKAARAVDPGNR
jgi:hypothetical protein